MTNRHLQRAKPFTIVKGFAFSTTLCEAGATFRDFYADALERFLKTDIFDREPLNH